MKITLVAGARPNFMKISPIIKAIQRFQKKENAMSYKLVHTGQHYDDKLSNVFFDELEIPRPDLNLEVGSGSQAEQTGKIMIAFEKYLESNPCDLVIVVGDVNSTMACTIVAKKLNTKVAHVEAGIRSFDMSMPEEINRMVTDALADYFFTTSVIANENLLKAGIEISKIFFVGNTMIDCLIANLEKIHRPLLWDEYKLKAKEYYVLTLHRPSNVDDPAKFEALISAINENMDGASIVFPVHPRTRRHLDSIQDKQNIITCDPLSYLEFIYMIKSAKGIITDSGGVQEETTFLNVPCITLRNNTERPETVEVGTNEIIGDDLRALSESINRIKSNTWKKGRIPELWDGHTAERIVNIIGGFEA